MSPLAALMDRCSLLPLRPLVEMLIRVRVSALSWAPHRLPEITATSLSSAAHLPVPYLLLTFRPPRSAPTGPDLCRFRCLLLITICVVGGAWGQGRPCLQASVNTQAMSVQCSGACLASKDLMLPADSVRTVRYSPVHVASAIIREM